MSPPTQPDRAAVRVFPPAVPLIAILMGVILERFWPLPIDFGLEPTTRHWIGGVIIVGAILVLGVWTFLLFRQIGQDPNPWKPTPAIVERGPFRFTRNPMYLQMLLILIGVAVFLANGWILIFTPVAAWLLQHFVIRHEEEYLERKFGETYLDYKRRVRRWM